MSLFPTTEALLTNGAYYPVRRIKPFILACVHITDNKENAQAGGNAALRERNYANREGSGGPSAHYYINRDGSRVHAISLSHTAWSNGDLKSPRIDVATVARLVQNRANGINANHGVYLETECVGWDAPAGQWTDEQFTSVAELIADASRATGLPINRETVIPHAYINSIDRANCAFLHATLEGSMNRLVTAARAFLDLPDVPTHEDTTVQQFSAYTTPYVCDAPKGEVLYTNEGCLPDANNVLIGDPAPRTMPYLGTLPGSKVGVVVYSAPEDATPQDGKTYFVKIKNADGTARPIFASRRPLIAPSPDVNAALDKAAEVAAEAVRKLKEAA